MADAGITEAALLGAAATAAAETAGTAGSVAAMYALPAAATTAAGTAAAAAPVVAEAALPTVIPAALEAATVPTAAESLVAVGPEALTVPTAAEQAATITPTTGLLGSATETPTISLLSTESEPVTGGLLGQGAAEYPLPGPTTFASTSPYAAQDIGFGAGNVAPGFAGETLPAGTGLPTTTAPGTAPTASQLPGSNLLDKLGRWWETSSLGDKLSVGGKALGGISSAQKVLAPTAGTSAGPKTTIKPGSTGVPRGGEQALAAVVEQLLKRRDAYQNAQYGTPIAYRPRSLLG